MNDQLLQLVLRHQTVPSIPAFAVEVIQLCGDEEASLQDVALAVQKDAATTARLLRLANSSAFGLVRSVTSLSQAVFVLGLRTVRTITVATALVRGLSSRQDGAAVRARWMGALVTALAARRLAERRKGLAPDEGFVAGLLQDVGVYLMMAAVEGYRDVLDAAAKGDGDLARLEREAFDLCHSEVGAALLEQWQFPAAFVEAVREHEQPGEGCSSLGRVLFVAESYRRVLERPNGERVAELIRRSREMFEIAEEETVDCLGYIERNLSEVAQSLEIRADATALAAARARATELLIGSVLPLDASESQGTPGRRAMEGGLAVLRIALDHIEDLRARHGERVLSEINEHVQDTVRRVVRRTDFVMRWRGDEVAVLAPSCRGPDAERIGLMICRSLENEPASTREGEIGVTASIGVAWDSQYVGPDFTPLLRRADAHLLNARQNGGNCCRGPAATTLV